MCQTDCKYLELRQKEYKYRTAVAARATATGQILLKSRLWYLPERKKEKEESATCGGTVENYFKKMDGWKYRSKEEDAVCVCACVCMCVRVCMCETC